MSLLRLLTTGKSLVGVRETDSRYRLTTQRLLPDFGSARNPFGAGDKEKPAPVEMAPPSSSSESSDARPAGVAGSGLRQRATILLAGWASSVGGLWQRSKLRTLKPGVLGVTRPPVQAELSLDRIKVVRNDLSDADLEVIQLRKPAAVTKPARRTQVAVAGTAEMFTCDSVGVRCPDTEES